MEVQLYVQYLNPAKLEFFLFFVLVFVMFIIFLFVLFLLLMEAGMSPKFIFFDFQRGTKPP